MSERDGSVLPDEPDEWDIELMAGTAPGCVDGQPDFDYLRLIRARLAVMALEAVDRLSLEQIKVCGKEIDGLVHMDNELRERQDLPRLREYVERLEAAIEKGHQGGDRDLGEPPMH